jgi:putative phosphoribosyl transferase
MESLEAQTTAVAIMAGRISLRGRLHVPPDANGLVLFTHGGGSGCKGLGDQRIAESLHDVGLATLLVEFSEHLRKDADIAA